jgi:hypothetical protein
MRLLFSYPPFEAFIVGSQLEGVTNDGTLRSNVPNRDVKSPSEVGAGGGAFRSVRRRTAA